MKALIISDKQDVITLLKKNLESQGYDTIVYRWFIKALDNVEEICPDYIILSAEEYPRHWKTLASYVQSGIGGNDVRFCLYNDELLSDEDKEKAVQLGVEFYSEIKEFPNQNESTQIENSNIKVDDIDSSFDKDAIPTVNEIVTDNEQSAIITHPTTQKFIYAKCIKLENDTYDLFIDSSDFTINEKVEYVTVCNEQDCISFSAVIIGLTINKVSLKVLSHYEN